MTTLPKADTAIKRNLEIVTPPSTKERVENANRILETAKYLKK